nr:nucleotidyl transferase AbiEii/AbiGii toxin family protein [Adlercreutzia sp. ZJ138]
MLSYQLATVVAEKLETVVSRGTANTRGRDYYDLYILRRTMANKLNPDELREALHSTCEKRNSAGMLPNWESILEEVRSSDAMNRVWDSYLQDTPYAVGITFGQTMDAASDLLKLADWNVRS